MTTPQEIAHAIAGAVREFERGLIGPDILIRDVRAAIKRFDEQPTA